MYTFLEQPFLVVCKTTRHFLYLKLFDLALLFRQLVLHEDHLPMKKDRLKVFLIDVLYKISSPVINFILVPQK